MDTRQFERLSGRLERQLSVEQCMALCERLRRKALNQVGEVVIQRRTELAAERRTCPRCGHTDVVKHGRDASTDRQRFRCRRGEAGGCGRTFNAVTGSPLARLRRSDRWLAMAGQMREHRSLKHTARAIGARTGRAAVASAAGGG